MAGMIESLFGLSPYEVQRQEQQAMQQRAADLARMSNTEAASYGYGLAGQAFARGLTGPSMEEQQAAQRQKELAGIDVNDPESLMAAAARVTDPSLQASLVARASELKRTLDAEKRKAELDATVMAKNLADAAKDQAALTAPPPLKAPPMRTIIKGGMEIQQEMQPDGTWKEIGKGERFARQIVPTASVTGGETTGPLSAAYDPEAVDFYAKSAMLGDQSWRVGLGRSKHGVELILAVDKRIPQLAKEVNMTPEQIAANKQEFSNRLGVLKSFTSGPLGNTTRSLGVAIDHLDTLGELGKALNNRDTRAINAVANNIAVWTGGAAPTNFDAAKQLVADEVVKAIVGGVTALGDRDQAAKTIANFSSPAQLEGYITNVKKLMAGQLEGLAHQYKAGTKRDDFETTLLPPKARALVKKPGAAPQASPASLASQIPTGSTGAISLDAYLKSKGY